MLTSLTRTLVPMLVGYLMAVPVVLALGISQEQATAALTAIISAVYYLLARVLEVYVSPRFGVLLGATTPPTYPVASSGGRHELSARYDGDGRPQ